MDENLSETEECVCGEEPSIECDRCNKMLCQNDNCAEQYQTIENGSKNGMVTWLILCRACSVEAHMILMKFKRCEI